MTDQIEYGSREHLRKLREMQEGQDRLTKHGQKIEDAAAMRRIAREIDALGERHPVTTGALLLRIRADQIDPAHAESAPT